MGALPKPAGRVHDRVYLAWVRTQPCLFRGGHRCQGRVEAHHTGRRPLGRKCDDREGVPLCSRAHRDWEHAAGVFKGLDQTDRRQWARRAIAYTQARWAAQQGVHVEDV